MMISVNPAVPANNLKELIDYARDQAAAAAVFSLRMRDSSKGPIGDKARFQAAPADA
jgi:hypothetical protein